MRQLGKRQSLADPHGGEVYQMRTDGMLFTGFVWKRRTAASSASAVTIVLFQDHFRAGHDRSAWSVERFIED